MYLKGVLVWQIPFSLKRAIFTKAIKLNDIFLTRPKKILVRAIQKC